MRPSVHPHRVRFAEFLLDLSARLLTRADQPVHLQPKVMELLILLVQNHLRFVPKHELQAELWRGVVVGDASLPRLVKELRRALGDCADEPRLVRTVHGRGYQFIAPVVMLDEPRSERRDSALAPGATAHAVDTADSTNTASHDDPLRDGSLELRPLHPSCPPAVPLGGSASLRIGRSEACAIQVPSEQASRQHAEIFREGPLLLLRDLGSRNGTYVNGARISRPVFLRPGQLVRIGGDWLGLVCAPRDDARPLSLHPLCDLPSLRQALADLCVRGGSNTDAVLIEGEAGTGKSCVARALHAWSERAGPLVPVDCGRATPEVERALVGAPGSRSAVEAAQGGTLLLEDVDELAPKLQRWLFDALTAADTGPKRASAARVIATSRQSLRRLERAGSFHPELAARLRGHEVWLKPLRERIEDIPDLFRHFLRQYAGGRAPEVSARLLEVLCLHELVDNASGLEALARQLLREHGDEPRLSRSHLPASLRASADALTRAPYREVGTLRLLGAR